MQSYEGIPLPAAIAASSREDDGPEALLSPEKKPKKAADKTGPPPSRFSLRMSAGWWRSLQYVGMSLHYMAAPRPPKPDYSKTIPSTLSPKKGKFTLQFYLPKDYYRTQGTGTTYPAVINYHGGGFTLGEGTDDARFARFVVKKCNAIFVSVDYRLAPECPFPTAVDDGADAILYLIHHAAELRIDPLKLATSGFSAGGNIALTAPLRVSRSLKTGTASSTIPNHKIVAVATWYPITDYTKTRAERRATSIRPDQTIPPALTDLFDASYLFPPELDLADPYLSPSKASNELLAEGIPQHVLFYTCEWDMLLREGEELAKRLEKEPINKKVEYTMIRGVPHGWDKGPNPLKPPVQSEELYQGCCEKLKRIFDGE